MSAPKQIRSHVGLQEGSASGDPSLQLEHAEASGWRWRLAGLLKSVNCLDPLCALKLG